MAEEDADLRNSQGNPPTRDGFERVAATTIPRRNADTSCGCAASRSGHGSRSETGGERLEVGFTDERAPADFAAGELPVSDKGPGVGLADAKSFRNGRDSVQEDRTGRRRALGGGDDWLDSHWGFPRLRVIYCQLSGHQGHGGLKRVVDPTLLCVAFRGTYLGPASGVSSQLPLVPTSLRSVV